MVHLWPQLSQFSITSVHVACIIYYNINKLRYCTASSAHIRTLHPPSPGLSRPNPNHLSIFISFIIQTFSLLSVVYQTFQALPRSSCRHRIENKSDHSGTATLYQNDPTYFKFNVDSSITAKTEASLVDDEF